MPAFLFSLLLSLLAHSSAPFERHFPATQVEGFARSSNGPIMATACAMQVSRDGHGALRLQIHSDPISAIHFEIVENFELPLREGILPTFQMGLTASYESGVLILRKQDDLALFHEELKIAVGVDPFLLKPKWAEGSLSHTDHFYRRPRVETQRLVCHF